MGACCGKPKNSKPPGIFDRVDSISIESKLKPEEERPERLSAHIDSPAHTRPSIFSNLTIYCEDPPISYEIHYIESITIQLLKSHILNKYPVLQNSEIGFYRDSLQILNLKGKLCDLGIQPGDTLTILKLLSPAKFTEEVFSNFELQSPRIQESVSQFHSQVEDSKSIEFTPPSKKFRTNLAPLSTRSKNNLALKSDGFQNYFENNVKMKSYIKELLLEQVFDTYNFSFKEKLGRELARGTDRIINSLILTLNEFFHTKAIEIHNLKRIARSELEMQDIKDLVSKRGYDVCTKLDPFLERTWRLAISNTASYYKLCNLLVGQCIDRLSTSHENLSISWSRKIWPHYTETIAEYESLHTLWLKPSQFHDLIHGLKKYIVKKSSIFTHNIILSPSIDKAISKSRAFLHSFSAILRISKPVESCPYIDPSKHSDPLHEIKQNLESFINKDLFLSMLYKECNILSKSLAAEYLEEYIRFLILQYYTSIELYPSAEVEYLWNLHCSYTRDYREMCMKIYGRIITHNLAGNEENRYVEQYQRTLTLYEYVFQEQPPGEIWPNVEKRFSAEYEMASWVSILRVFGLMVGFFKEGVFNSTTDTGFIKQHINIYYLSWPENDSSGFEFIATKNRKTPRHTMINPNVGMKPFDSLAKPVMRSNLRLSSSPPVHKQNFLALFLEKSSSKQATDHSISSENSQESIGNDSRSFSNSSESLDNSQHISESFNVLNESSLKIEDCKSLGVSKYSERISDCSIGKESKI